MVMPPPDKVECPDCKGSGRLYCHWREKGKGDWFTCTRCRGSGEVDFLEKKY